MKIFSNSKRERRLILLFVSFLLLVWGWSHLTKWGFEKALPSTAKEVKVWSEESMMLPDYRFYMRARISESEFLDYIKEFDMTPHFEGREYDKSMGGFLINLLDWKGGPDWWNPSLSLENTYVNQVLVDEWIFAKYENGYIYMKGARN